MLMQYIDGGELWLQIHNFGARAFPLCIYYITEILKAINSIHKQGIVHRDIKSENILLTQDKKIKFIDFGTAKDMNDLTIEGSGNGRKGKQIFKHFVGTPQFMAPECIRDKILIKNQIYILWECYFMIQFLESIHLMERVIIWCFNKHQRQNQNYLMMGGQTINSLEVSSKR
ncbi:unnamed protein product [Paramecium sonneborni]|uniref:Protein kinase domain-containing protein n=1 Tax=Paramecium sonneborni TaxID=65129 RepID=A0A8S1QT41_9CILI|nr:unnamed protein product [Paramecium sonneborni]